jgi:hypothetical protein
VRGAEEFGLTQKRNWIMADEIPRAQQVQMLHSESYAKLAADSGWTQDRLAKKLGWSQKMTDRLVRFGRFLNWIRSSNMLLDTNALRERPFFDAWRAKPSPKTQPVTNETTMIASPKSSNC